MIRRNKRRISRRNFLKTGAAATAALSVASQQNIAIAQGDSDYDFLLPRLRLECVGNSWNWGPGGEANLLRAFSQAVRCNVKINDNVNNDNPEYGGDEHFNAIVDLDRLDETPDYPIIFGTGMGSVEFTRRQREHLKEYIQQGGFLLLDECAHPNRADEFFQSSVREVETMFGRGKVVPIPRDHEIWHNVYDLSAQGLQMWARDPYAGGRTYNNPGERDIAIPDTLGVFIENRLAVYICNADIHCGWTDPYDSWIKRANHETSIKAGINLLLYALSH